MEHAPEVLHRRLELGGIRHLHRVGQYHDAAGFQNTEAVGQHVLAGLTRQLMQQEHTGDALHAALGEGHGLTIALHQLGQFTGQLR